LGQTHSVCLIPLALTYGLYNKAMQSTVNMRHLTKFKVIQLSGHIGMGLKMDKYGLVWKL